MQLIRNIIVTYELFIIRNDKAAFSKRCGRQLIREIIT